jgi:hypothetical protein
MVSFKSDIIPDLLKYESEDKTKKDDCRVNSVTKG